MTILAKIIKEAVQLDNEKEEKQLDEVSVYSRKELTIDDKYIHDVLAMMSAIKKENPDYYLQVEAYLKDRKGQKTYSSPETFAKDREDFLTSKGSTGIMSAGKDKATFKNVDIDMTRQAQVDAATAAMKKYIDDMKKAQTPQKIKSIWIKDISIDVNDDSKSTAKVSVTRMDGTSTGDLEWNIGMNIAGDKTAKQIRYFFNGLKSKDGKEKPYTEVDVRIAYLMNVFPDPRIKWYFGQTRKQQSEWAFTNMVHQLELAEMIKKDMLKDEKKQQILKSTTKDFNDLTINKAGKPRILTFGDDADDEVDESVSNTDKTRMFDEIVKMAEKEQDFIKFGRNVMNMLISANLIK